MARRYGRVLPIPRKTGRFEQTASDCRKTARRCRVAHLAWKPSIVKGATIHVPRIPPVSTGTSGLAGHLVDRSLALLVSRGADRLGGGAVADTLALTPIGPG